MTAEKSHVVSAEGYKQVVDPSASAFFFLAEGDVTNGAFDLARVVEPAGSANVPLHIHHRTDEAFYVLRGRATVQVGNDTFTVGPGDFCMMPRGIPHTYAIHDGEDFEALCTLSPAGELPMFEELADAQPEPGDPDLELLQPVLGKYGIEVVGPPISK
jgi:mannose-6-phosphate isomerase-like protein (cupin superfamily)